MGPPNFVQPDTETRTPPVSCQALRTDSLFLRVPEYRIPVGIQEILRKPFGVIFPCQGSIYINVAAISPCADG